MRPKEEPVKIPYAGAETVHEELVPEESKDALKLQAAEAENERLRNTLRSTQAALRTAGKILSPYVAKSVSVGPD